MVGDHPAVDISGGRAVGLRTGWVTRGKKWPREMAAPDLSAGTAAEVIDAVVQLGAKNTFPLKLAPRMKDSGF